MNNTNWVYIDTDDGKISTVGFYSPDGKWHAESDHTSRLEAAKRVHWLNGGEAENTVAISKLRDILIDLETWDSGGDAAYCQTEIRRIRAGVRITLEELKRGAQE